MSRNFSKDLLPANQNWSALIRFWLKRIFVDDWLLKLTALLISFALWVGVTGFQEPTQTRLRSITLNPLFSNQFEIINSPVKEVDLVVSGEKRKLDQLNPRDLVISLDLTNVTEGERTVEITAKNITVDLPTGVKIDQILPDKIAVKLERVEEYEVPIRAELVGNPGAGYEIYSTKIVPEKVRVRGPKSFVKALNFISTEKIRVHNQTTNFTAPQVALTVTNSKITLVDAVSASVSLRIGKKRIERLFVVEYETQNRKGKASILLYGPRSVLEDLDPTALRIVEVAKAKKPTGLDVVLPDALKDEVEVRNVKYRE